MRGFISWLIVGLGICMFSIEVKAAPYKPWLNYNEIEFAQPKVTINRSLVVQGAFTQTGLFSALSSSWFKDTSYFGGAVICSTTTKLIGNISAIGDIWVNGSSCFGDAAVCSTTTNLIGTVTLGAGAGTITDIVGTMTLTEDTVLFSGIAIATTDLVAGGDVTATGNDYKFSSGAMISNNIDTLYFQDASENLGLVFSTNLITVKSTSGVTKVDFGTLDVSTSGALVLDSDVITTITEATDSCAVVINGNTYYMFKAGIK